MGVDQRAAALVQRFVADTQALLLRLKRLYPADETVDRAAQRVSIAAREVPLAVLQVVGPQLLRHRERIISADGRFLTDTDFGPDLRGDSERVEYARYIIPLVQRAWPQLDAAARADVHATVLRMLAAYCDYSADQLRAARQAGRG